MRELRTTPDPILRQPVRGVMRFDRTLRHLVEDMFAVMDAQKGVGLAAPQIGIRSELFVARYHGTSYVCVNPYPLKWEGQMLAEEGCLSIPKYRLVFPRMASILVKYQDLDGNSHELLAENMLGRIFQHEMDHLTGTLITDYETPHTWTSQAATARTSGSHQLGDRAHAGAVRENGQEPPH